MTDQVIPQNCINALQHVHEQMATGQWLPTVENVEFKVKEIYNGGFIILAKRDGKEYPFHVALSSDYPGQPVITIQLPIIDEENDSAELSGFKDVVEAILNHLKYIFSLPAETVWVEIPKLESYEAWQWRLYFPKPEDLEYIVVQAGDTPVDIR